MMRYKWLDDRIDELVERYESGQSLQEIADALDVSTSPIHSRLQATDVEIRNGGPRHVQLADRVDDLADRYVDQHQSLQAIANQYETSIAAVRYHLEQADIDCEPGSTKTTDVGLSPSQLSIIEGELLGDGCLHRREPGNCFFQLSTTTKAHAVRVMEKLPDSLFPDTQPISFTRPNQYTGDKYTMWTVSSRPQPLFGRIYEEWYETRDRNNRKILPESYNLDRTALLHWYWGDGSCSIRNRGAPRVCFATHGFPEESVEDLQTELDQIGYDNYAVKQEGTQDGSGLLIRLRDYDARRFLTDLRRLNTLPQYDRKFLVPVKEESTD
ncbi:endonuclease I [Halosegnis longus]|uniref:endonuclease I n=1 Tax=Halosegnis longus TaxID=2216012 RepID=UPI00190F0356|nr:endonuclease I [Salella cibi]